MTLLAISLSAVLSSLSPDAYFADQTIGLAPSIAGLVPGGDDGDPLDCPLFNWVMENCTPIPEDQQEEMQELLESLGYRNSGVYTFGSTIFIVTIVSFTECPMVTVL